MSKTRVLIDKDPFFDPSAGDSPDEWREIGEWPAQWITVYPQPEPPFVVIYRRKFRLNEAATIRLHVSADERYKLFVDGEFAGQGPERGDPSNWFFETYDISFDAGEHMLVALVWTLGRDKAPHAQMTVRPGFICATEGEYGDLLDTGVAAWEARFVTGIEFIHPDPAWGTGWNQIITESDYPQKARRGAGGNWQPVTPINSGAGLMTGLSYGWRHRLQSAILPPMIRRKWEQGSIRHISAPETTDTTDIRVAAATHLSDEATIWNGILTGEPVTIPADTMRRVILDLEDYVCAYPELHAEGGAGASVRVYWAEALFDHDGFKRNRDEIEGKHFAGTGDEFRLSGGESRKLDTLWWQAGRYIEIVVQTADDPLALALNLYETRYPLEIESDFTASDQRLLDVVPLMVRGMQMCAHETYFDCPYYEQLMYAGDTRLEVLTTYIMTRDDRLPRKFLRIFDSSRNATGLTEARYPNKEYQAIPPFALWWAASVVDYAYWRDDLDFVRERMPGVRAVMEGYAQFTNSDSLIEGPEGWNFMDWVRKPVEWASGVPPSGAFGVSALMNWHYVLVLAMVARLERELGEPLLADRLLERARGIVAALEPFWDESRGLYVDDASGEHVSEHTQCMALLSGMLDDERAARIGDSLLTADLTRTTIYFTHYVFETYRQLGRVDQLIERMDLWFDLKAMGFRTPVETPEPSRSDCHAWGSHPLFHYFATILGIRPGGIRFQTVEITPQLGPLDSASGRLVHPSGGEIVIDVQRDGDTLTGTVALPDGVTGTLHVNEGTITLSAGETAY